MNTEAQVKDAPVAEATRVITIVATVGEKIKVNFTGTKWAELKALLQKGGKDIDGNSFSPYNLSNIKCVESTNKTTLEHAEAVIPDGNFNLFLMPYKSKSGAAMSRTEINAAIKGHIEKDGDKAKSHFSEGGKNYTQLSSTLLIEKLEAYKPGTKKAAKAAKAEATANVADVVASVKANKEGNVDLFSELQGLTTDEKLDVVIKLLIDMKHAGQVVVAAEPVESEEDKQARLKREEEEAEAKRKDEEAKAEQKRKDDEAKAEAKRKADLKREEDKKLDNEMSDLMSGFSDVRK